MFRSLQRQVENLIQECVELAYFMRGACNYDAMLQRTPGERSKMSSFIEKRLEQEAKSPHPVY